MGKKLPEQRSRRCGGSECITRMENKEFGCLEISAWSGCSCCGSFSEALGVHLESQNGELVSSYMP